MPNSAKLELKFFFPINNDPQRPFSTKHKIMIILMITSSIKLILFAINLLRAPYSTISSLLTKQYAISIKLSW